MYQESPKILEKFKQPLYEVPQVINLKTYESSLVRTQESMSSNDVPMRNREDFHMRDINIRANLEDKKYVGGKCQEYATLHVEKFILK